jgi:hypothetical protein
MRTSSLALAALAVSIAVPAAFAKDTKTPTKKAPSVHVAKQSLSNCTSFDQVDKDEDTTTFSIKSSCSIPIDCSISWNLVCAPQSKSRRAVHTGSAKFTALGTDSSQSTDASAATCGADSWSIESIQWSCAPNND